jgi:Fe-Mn family superoxide dismutase
MPFKLPPLTYPYDALEPFIDAKTVEIHHDKHHQAYVDNFNAALEKVPEWAVKDIEEILKNLSSVPEGVRTAVRNHGGGHFAHTMYWSIMKQGGGETPKGPIGEAIQATFGGFEEFKQQFNDCGLKRFGSGWAWLVMNTSGNLQIMSTANQDNPLTDGFYPIMVNDVWEHAYYLKYQNRRGEYLNQWWNTVNWDAINERFKLAK